MVVDETMVRQTLNLLKPNGQLMEIRAINGKKNLSMYTKNIDIAIEELKKQNLQGFNVYLVLNSINDDCYSREQRDHFVFGANATTADTNIEWRDWVLIDLDPNRSKGTSATKAQIDFAYQKSKQINAFLSQQGFNLPIIGFSGNGIHLLYKIDMDNTDERRDLIKAFLNTLSVMFSDKDISVDTANFNAARVCKLWGTLAQKGSNTPERPHRMSKIMYVPPEIKVNSIALFQKVVDILREVPEPKAYNNYNPKAFDVGEWLNKYYPHSYTKEAGNGCTKYILEKCPFNEEHTGKDAVVFKMDNGALGFHCFHNSCSDKHWSDLRKLYQPDYKEAKAQKQTKEMYNSFNREKPIEEEPDVPMFYTAEDIVAMKKEEETFVKTGYTQIDKKLRGLKKGFVTCVSGLSGSGKTTWLDGLMLNAIEAGNRVGCFSYELEKRNFFKWLFQVAAGKNYVEPSGFEGYYNVPEDIQKKIAEWLEGKFWLYNNDYGNNYCQLLEHFEKQIDEKKLDLFVIDNLMAFNISGLSDDKWDAQSQFVWSLQKLAKEKNIHVLFVAHPRKVSTFLRPEDISGSADLRNAVDNLILIHRVTADFNRKYREMYKIKKPKDGEDDAVMPGTNAVEISKDRDGGTQEYYFPLYFEQESRRLRNTPTENIIYGWNKDEYLPVVGETPFD